MTRAINGASDDAAIATDKIGFTGTGTATFASVSSFFRGITGVMVDLQPLDRHALEHHALQQRHLVQVHRGLAVQRHHLQQRGRLGSGSHAGGDFDPHRAGTGGSDRIEITWNNGSIKQGWLEVDVKANANTGLSSPDVFYFGSAIGDSGVGDSASLAVTNSTDVTMPRTTTSV